MVYLGAGLETAYDRLHGKNPGVDWYEVDLPEVMDARKKVFGQRDKETLISGDMFKLEWVKEVDATLPTLLVVSGVFQYFHEEEIVVFIKACGEAFPKGEMIFDATSESGLKFTNWFIKRTGNKNALMYFGINDSKAFAEKCGVELLEVKTFYPDALSMLGKRLNLVTRVSMKVAEKKKLKNVIATKIFVLDGMHCEKCANRVTEIVNDIQGCAGVVNLKKGIVTVSYQQEVPDGQIKERIERIGYTVKEIR